MSHVKKIQSVASQIIFTAAILIVVGVFGVLEPAGATGLSVGNTSFTLNPWENLYYGIISSTATSGNFLLFEKGAGNTIFKIDYAGNITTNGAVLGSNTLWALSGSNLYASSTSWNLGVGTTNPGAKLQIDTGNILLSNPSWSSTGSQGYGIRMQNNAVRGYSLLNSSDTLVASYSAYTNTDGTLRFAYIGTDYNSPWLVINSGNVGIGTTNPTSRLDVGGTGGLKNSYSTTFSALGGAGNVMIMGDNTGTLYSTSTAAFISGNKLDLWSGTKNGNIWNGAAGAGNVGIGTTNPGALFHVKSPSGSLVARFEGLTNAYDSKIYISSTSSGDGGFQYLGGNKMDLFSYGDMAFNVGTGNISGTIANERVRITQGGNVGIGTTAPGQLFEVAGGTQIKSNGIVYLGYTDATAPLGGMKLSINGASYTSGNAIINGNVGIGTSTPGNLLEVYGSGGITINSNAGSDTLMTPLLRYYRLGVQKAYVGYDSTGDTDFTTYNGIGNLKFRSDNNDIIFRGAGESMRILNAGNVGIGTTNPGARLDVGGTGGLKNSYATTFSALGAAGNVMVMADNTGTLYSTSTAAFVSGNSLDLWEGTKNGTIWNGDAGVGNVGIGTTAPIGKLQIGANTISGANGVYNNSRIGTMVNGALTSIVYASTYNDPTYPDYGLVFVHASSTSDYNVWSISPDGPAKGNNLNFIYQANATNIHTQIPKVVFKGDGNVGIGITNPSTKLSFGNLGSNKDVLSIYQDSSGTAGIGTYGVAGLKLYSYNSTYDVAIGARTGTDSMATNMIIKGTGNVGIGTTNPQAALHTLGRSSVENRIQADTSPYGAAVNLYYADTSGLKMSYTAADAVGWIDNYYSVTGSSVVYGDINFRSKTGGGSTLNTNMTIKGYAGNVGIGTTNPGARLDVGGTGGLKNSYATTFSALGAAGNVMVMADNTGTLYSTSTAAFVSGNSLDLWEGTKNGTIWNGDAGVGNVGIGTVSPDAKINIFGTQGSGSVTPQEDLFHVGGNELGNAGGYAGIKLGGTQSGMYSTYIRSIKTHNYSDYWNSDLVFSVTRHGTATTVDEVMRIASDGNIGIGSTAPTKKLEIQGGTLTSGANNFALKLKGTYGGTDWTGILFGATHSDFYNKGGIIFRSTDGSNLRGQLQFLLNNVADASTGVTANTDAKMVVDYSGNVGIGMTNPGYKFDVSQTTVNNGSGTNVIVGNFNSTVTAGSGAANAGSAILRVSTAGGPHATDIEQNDGGSAPFRYGTYMDTNIVNKDLSSGAYGNINFVTGSNVSPSSIVMTIGGGSQKGNVGVGTASPGARLDVAGTGGIKNSYATTLSALGAAGNVLVMADNTGTLYSTSTASFMGGASLWGGTKNSNIWNGDAGVGNVGIGTTAPNAKLNLPANSEILIGVGSSSDGLGISYNNAGATDAYIRSYYNNDSAKLHVMMKNTNEVMTILGSGYVGIGTTAPGAKLTIAKTASDASVNQLQLITPGNIVRSGEQTITADTAAIDYFIWGASTGDLYKRMLDFRARGAADGTNGDSAIRFFTNSKIASSVETEKMRIDGTGNVGIGITNPSNKLMVNVTNAVTENVNYAVYGKIAGSPSFTTAAGNFDNITTGSGTAGNSDFGVVGSATGAGVSNVGGSFRANSATSYNTQLLLGTSVAPTDSYSIYSSLSTKSYFAGNVGIGTTAPGEKLDVRGNVLSKAAASGNTWGMYLRSHADSLVGKFEIAGSETSHNGTLGLVSNNSLDIVTGNVSRIHINENSPGNGNVGVGTASPGARLDVAGTGGLKNSYATTFSALGGLGNVMVMADNTGTLYATSSAILSGSYLALSGGTMAGDINMGGYNITNLNKLTVSTIDPLYKINGVNYSTFAPSISGGVKEEYIGKIKIQDKISTKEYEAIVDFSQVEVGSDLWVWRKVIDFNHDNIEVLITPYGRLASVYYLIDNNKLIFRSDRAVEVSYRLTGKRFDWRQWPTRALDQTENGREIR